MFPVLLAARAGRVTVTRTRAIRPLSSRSPSRRVTWPDQAAPVPFPVSSTTRAGAPGWPAAGSRMRCRSAMRQADADPEGVGADEGGDVAPLGDELVDLDGLVEDEGVEGGRDGAARQVELGPGDGVVGLVDHGLGAAQVRLRAGRGRH